HFNLFSQKITEPRTILALQTVQRRRLLDDFFKPPLRSRSAVAANQQGNLGDARNMFQQLHHPDFPDETGHTDEQNMFPGQCAANAEMLDSRSAFKRHDGWSIYGDGAASGLCRGLECGRLAKPKLEE